MSLHAKISAALKAGHRFDDDLNVGDERDLPSARPTRTAAAVLIAITDRAEPGVILTQRPANMRSHPGQVAFPGGKIDPEDKDAIAAALREADEEIGLNIGDVNLIGTTDSYISGSGYAITPVLAVIPPDLPFRPNPHEVESWFETPLSYLLDRDNLVQRSAIWNGAERQYWEVQWQQRRIWGVTAGIIVNLRERLKALQL